ncbi:hypothetical protein [Porphyrobacter sp. ULC335]|uniref:hypothetical protein n=1 Tax=Porphyrobacter sp. ULC335 TaxID=2854260 RepID=UPI002220D875|nr:hypothetical protein [Porphyrobacter sp. ULC335]UYV14412.1 hypothetical protein KVF90_09515 [Porphyrobacter sp. ULC335]
MADRHHLPPPPSASGRQATSGLAPMPQAMAGFWDRSGGEETAPDTLPDEQPEQAQPVAAREPATATLGRRAGAVTDELDFPEFVASLIHGTWDAMVDSSIRQMDAYADLVAAISKPLSQFRDENVTANQARDWLVAQYPGDLALVRGESEPLVIPRGGSDEFGDAPSPAWLREYGADGQPLSPELIEEVLVPAARDRLAGDRMQTLATLVMMGMNRIVVRDGSITARLKFRASAADKTAVDYAVSDDPASATPTGSWSTRGSTAYASPVTKVSTVGVNAQTDTTLNAELFGEVKINFASETIPLDRFVDDARRTMLERAAKPAQITAPAPAPAPALASMPAPAVPVSAPMAPPVPVPAPVAVAAPVPVPAPATPAEPRP